MPSVNYLFISTDGTVSVPDAEYLKTPLVLSLEKSHDELTLQDYFLAMEQFLAEDSFERLCEAASLASKLDSPLDPSQIDSVTICSVKIGAYYHIARIDITCGNVKSSLALSASFTSTGRNCLEYDFRALEALHKGPAAPYLPVPFSCGEVSMYGHSFFMVLGEWLEGFHEWHFSDSAPSGRRAIVLWDGRRGSYLSQEQESGLFQKIALILTLCFDPSTGKQVCEWHHAAGDFIVSLNENGTVDVRLTTIRSYRPLFGTDFTLSEGVVPGLLFFFLDLATRIRMDRLDGIGEPVWAESRFLEDTVKGFSAGLKVLEQARFLKRDHIEEFALLLYSMSSDELLEIFASLMQIYQREYGPESRHIAENLEEHSLNLYKVLKQGGLLI